MKKYIALALILFSSVSCGKFLDVDRHMKDRMTLDEVFSKRDYTEQWLAEAYSYMSQPGMYEMGIDTQSPFLFGDELYHPFAKDVREVTYDSEDYQASWKHCYRGIRQASIFIHNVDKCKDYTEAERTDLKAQARFVRAFYYWKLLQKYGPFPIMPDEGQDYTDEYIELSIPRSTYEECANYISDEMVKAAKDLPLKRDGVNIVRPTRGAALAYRAKALLYAASPLMNGNTDSYAMQFVDNNGKQLLSSQYDEKKWAVAAAAAKDVMELNVYRLNVAYAKINGDNAYPATITPFEDGEFSEANWPEGYADIDPFESYRSLFNGDMLAGENPELIYTRGGNSFQRPIVRMVYYQLPNMGYGTNNVAVTQKQVDAYYMRDGKDCPGKDLEIGRGDGSARATGYLASSEIEEHRPCIAGVSMQYVDREPRFYASIAYNGAEWGFQNAADPVRRGPKACWYYRGTSEGFNEGTGHYPLTGIGMMKFVNPADINDDGHWDYDETSHILRKVDLAMRYADVLLMYAEAINELTASYDIPAWDESKIHTVARTQAALEEAVHPIRIRAGVPDYADEVYADAALFREKIKRERQIEMFAEGQRYFDVRRWKDAQKEESLPMYGCNVLMTEASKDAFHQPVAIFDVLNSFVEKTYFWPLHRDYLTKNVRLTQCPGWDSEY